MAVNLEKNVVTSIYRQKDENIVANLSLYNPPNSGKPIEASIDVSLEKPILRKMSEYKVMIARFKVPLFNIFPSFDLKNLMFQVTFRLAGVNYTNSQTIANTIYSISEFVTIDRRALWGGRTNLMTQEICGHDTAGFHNSPASQYNQ
jgi:hypothetical protein